METDEKSYFFDDPKKGNWLLYALYAICALALVAELFVHRHGYVDMEKMFGFYAVCGLVSSLVIVVLGRVLGYVLRRKEDYYDD